MASKSNRALAAIFLAAATLFGALSLFVAGPSAAHAQGMSSDAHVRVVHASPDAPAVDIYVNGTKAISGLAFGKVSDWATLPAGSYDVKVTAAGGTDAVITATLPLEAGKYYTVVAEGKLANITPKVLVDDLSALEAGKGRIRVIHASPDAPAVDVAVKGGPVLIPNLAFPNASDYMTANAGTLDLEVRPTGTMTAALSIPGFNLEAGKVYSVYAIGLLNGTPALTVLPVVDSAVSATTTAGPQPGMPKTGAGDNLFSLSVLALMLAAIAALATGVAVRVRNR